MFNNLIFLVRRGSAESDAWLTWPARSNATLDFYIYIITFLHTDFYIQSLSIEK